MNDKCMRKIKRKTSVIYTKYKEHKSSDSRAKQASVNK